MREWQETELGRIPSHWQILKVDQIKNQKKGSIAMGPFGSDITTDNFVEEGVPVIRGNNLNDFIFGDNNFVFVSEEKADTLKNSLCYPGDIIFTHRGTIGQVGIIPNNSNYKRYVVSQSGMKLTVDENIVSPEFVHLFFKSRIGQHILLKNKSQVGVPAIGQPTTSLKEMIVPIPPKNESDLIAKTLLSIQEKISLLRQQNQTLEELAQTLFKRWFVDFEFPNDKGKPYKSSGGKMIDSELGEIPDGWKLKRIGDLPIEISDFVANGSFAALKENVTLITGREDFALFIRNTDLKSNFKEKVYVDEHSYNFLKKTKLYGGEIIISNVGDVGSVFQCPYLEIPMTLGNNVIMLKSEFNNFLYLLFIGRNGQFLINGITSGSAQPKFNKTEFKSLEIVFPDENILNEFENQSLRIFKKINNNKQEINSYINLRDSLLPKLMSGEIEIN